MKRRKIFKHTRRNLCLPNLTRTFSNGSANTGFWSERRARRNICAWGTSQGSDLRVLSRPLINIIEFWSFPKNLSEGKVKFGGKLFIKIFLSSSTSQKVLLSSFLCRPVAQAHCYAQQANSICCRVTFVCSYTTAVKLPYHTCPVCLPRCACKWNFH